MYPRVPAAKAMCTIGVKLPTRPMYLACIYCCSVAYVHPRASTQVCTGPYTMWHIVTSVQPSERGWDKQLVKVRTRKRTPMTGCTEEEDVFQYYLSIYLARHRTATRSNTPSNSTAQHHSVHYRWLPSKGGEQPSAWRVESK